MQRCRLCPVHMKASQLAVCGNLLRFCQKCSKLHPLAAFDKDKRSCRVGLEKHNVRQRVLRAWTSVEDEDSGPHDGAGSKSSSLSAETAQAFNGKAHAPESLMELTRNSAESLSPTTPLLYPMEPGLTEPPLALLPLPVLELPELEDRTLDDLILAFDRSDEALQGCMGENEALETFC